MPIKKNKKDDNTQSQDIEDIKVESGLDETEETPTEETPTEETPTEDAPTEDAPTEAAPIKVTKEDQSLAEELKITSNALQALLSAGYSAHQLRKMPKNHIDSTVIAIRRKAVGRQY